MKVVARAPESLLTHPFSDKLLAVLALVPLLGALARLPAPGEWLLEEILLGIEALVIAATMLSRRPAVRMTADWRLWSLALLTAYWPALAGPFYLEGAPAVSRSLTAGLAITAFACAIWARCALGRNIGIVPAQRGLTQTGPYRWVRHPIYAALMVSIVAASLASWAWQNACLDLAWCLLVTVKARAEERFLALWPPYADYQERVPDRWFPLVALARRAGLRNGTR